MELLGYFFIWGEMVYFLVRKKVKEALFMKKVESFEEFGKRSIMPYHKDEGLLEFRITFNWVHYSTVHTFTAWKIK